MSIIVVAVCMHMMTKGCAVFAAPSNLDLKDPAACIKSAGGVITYVMDLISKSDELQKEPLDYYWDCTDQDGFDAIKNQGALPKNKFN